MNLTPEQIQMFAEAEKNAKENPCHNMPSPKEADMRAEARDRSNAQKDDENYREVILQFRFAIEEAMSTRQSMVKFNCDFLWNENTPGARALQLIDQEMKKAGWHTYTSRRSPGIADYGFVKYYWSQSPFSWWKKFWL